MKRIAYALLALLVIGFAAAQAPDVATTTGTGEDQFDIGRDAASVTQQVRLVVPPRVGLHLDVSELDFNLRDINTDQMVCFYGVRDVDHPLVINGRTSMLPRGLYYTPGGDFGTGVDIHSWFADTPVEEVTQYPPARFDAAGELIDGSKAGFVCFRTFIVQKFSNYEAGFEISVERTGGNFDMYVQDNSECSWNDAQVPGGPSGATGFYKIDDNATVGDLLPGVYSEGTTGSLSETCGGNDKGGWHDDQVIVAVAIDGQQVSGVDRAQLTYTIMGTTP